jgi:2-polyprenyl-3-methyl-5-hydroxy-6-metoxy-1,4-benzoquinol methylase
LVMSDISGMTYNPFTANYSLGNDVAVNYLAAYRR